MCCASAHSLGGFLLSPWPCCCSGLGSLAGGTYQKPDIPGATHSRTESQSMSAQSELGERQCNLGLNMSQSDKSEIVGKENMLIK